MDHQEYFPETTIRLEMPNNLSIGDEAYFIMNVEGYVRESKLIRFSKIYANRELVLWQDDKMIPESFAWPFLLERLYGSFKEKLKFRVKNKLRITKNIHNLTIWCLDGHSTGGYYHWIVEILPRLWMARQYLASGSIAIPDYFFTKWPFCKEFFNLLGINNFLTIENYNKYLIHDLLFTTRAGSPFYPQATPLIQAVRWLQSIALERNIDLKVCKERIYISRSKARYRKVLNEEELYPILEKYDFQIVNFEELSLVEQIHLCRNTKVILGLHGAGLTNLAFLPAEGKIIEIRPKLEEYTLNFFFILSQYFNVEYNYIFCEQTSTIFPEEKRIIDRSVIVSPRHLDSALSKIL